MASWQEEKAERNRQALARLERRGCGAGWFRAKRTAQPYNRLPDEFGKIAPSRSGRGKTIFSRANYNEVIE